MPNAMDPKYAYEVAAAIYPEPMALFERDPDWQPTFFHSHRVAIGSFFSVGATRMVSMYFRRRPIYSGLHRTAGYFLGGAALGEVIQILMDKYIDFRSQVHRHYMMLHPERFPPPKKVRIGDKFDLWMPSRND